MPFSKPGRCDVLEGAVTDAEPPAWKNPMAWLPFSIAEAALSGGGEDVRTVAAWAHLQERLAAAEQLVVSTPVNKNRVDYASGMRHLMVLLAVGIDMALRVDPDPVLAVNRAEHGRHRDLGYGMPGLRLHERELAGRRDLPAVRQPGHRPLRRTADDGRDGRHHQRPGRRSRGRRRRKLRGRSSRPTSTTATGCSWPATIRPSRCETSSTTGTPRCSRSLQIERIGDEVEPKDRSVDARRLGRRVSSMRWGSSSTTT